MDGGARCQAYCGPGGGSLGADSISGRSTTAEEGRATVRMSSHTRAHLNFARHMIYLVSGCVGIEKAWSFCALELNPTGGSVILL